MIQDSLTVLAVLLLLSLAGCGDAPDHLQKTLSPVIPSDETVAELEITDRELEVIRFILNSNDNHPGDRIYFLTTSPMSNWGETGDWKKLSPEFHASIENLETKYKPADEAYLKDGHVLEKSTEESGWMEWITIKRWISPTEVEVEEGVWCCPLGGGASTVIYEKIDGEWQFKESAGGWVS